MLFKMAVGLAIGIYQNKKIIYSIEPAHCYIYYQNKKKLHFAGTRLERDCFMSPEEAKTFGLIDTVLEHPPLPTDDGNAT